MTVHSRLELREMALSKRADAELLFAHGRYSSAYYLYGYSIEFGLKACIARRFVAETIPDRKFVNAIYVHDLDKLASLAGLIQDLQNARAGRGEFYANWTIVAQWSEGARYEIITRERAEVLRDAIENPDDGILPWLTRHW